MKKLLIAMFALMMFLSACQAKYEPNSSTGSKETSASVSEQPRGGEPNAAISIRGLEQLEEMRKMAEHQDVEELNLYLESIEGGGAKSREDLIDFLTLVDSLPTIKFIDGTISWISHQTGNSTDTGAYYDVVFVSTEAKNGNWTRIEYLLSVDDVSTEVDKRNDEGEFADSILENPIKSKNEKITVYSETREKHTSDKGEVIKWVLDVDGIFAQVVYYTNDANSVVTKNVFDSVSILNISEK